MISKISSPLPSDLPEMLRERPTLTVTREPVLRKRMARGQWLRQVSRKEKARQEA